MDEEKGKPDRPLDHFKLIHEQRGKAMYQCERSSIKGENRQNPNEDICQVLCELSVVLLRLEAYDWIQWNFVNITKLLVGRASNHRI